jgi:hypothetical protein
METWEKYLNINRKSNVLAYEIGNDYIRVIFNKTDAIYTYNSQMPGHSHVEQMKLFARRGIGLNSYIGTRIKKHCFKEVIDHDVILDILKFSS